MFWVLHLILAIGRGSLNIYYCLNFVSGHVTHLTVSRDQLHHHSNRHNADLIARLCQQCVLVNHFCVWYFQPRF